MTAASIPASGSVDEIGRSRRHLIYRLAFAAGGCMIVADGLDWTFPFVAPVLAVTLIASIPRPPKLLPGFLVFLVTFIATLVLRGVCNLLVDAPMVFIAVVSLVLFLSFYAHWRGAPGIVTLLVQLAAISIPLYAIISPSVAAAFSYLLWEATLVTVLLVWISFALFPAPIIRSPGQGPPPGLDSVAAYRRAGLNTLILLPMLVWHLFEVPDTYAFYTMFVAILMLRERSGAGRGQLADVHLRAAVLGGVAAIAAHLVVVSSDSFLVFSAIVLASCLLFATEVAKGGRYGAIMLLAYSTFLIVFGLGISEFVDAGDYLATRLGRLIFAILYVLAAASLAGWLNRRADI